MASVNKVILIGNLGATPELKYLPSGQAVCTFSLATTEKWNDKGGQTQERTEWHSVEVWGKQAEACGKYLDKGRSVYVEGQIRTDSWEDKETGQKKYRVKIVARDVRFLGGGKGAEGGAERDLERQRTGGGGGGGQDRPGQDFGPGDDDIPFACDDTFGRPL